MVASTRDLNQYWKYVTLLLIAACTYSVNEKNEYKAITSQEDSLRIVELKQKWRKSLYQSPDSIRAVAEEMIAFGTAINNKKALVSGNNMLAGYYSKVGNNERALEIQEENLIINGDDLEGLANIYNNIGNYYIRSGDYDLALAAQIKGLKAEEERENLEGISISLLNISGIYAHLGEKEKSLEHASRSFQIANENGFLPVKMQSAFQLAETHVKSGADSLALIFADSVIKVASQLNSEFGINKARSVQAKALANQGSLEKALEIIRGVRAYYSKNQIKSEALLQYITEASFLNQLNRYAESESVVQDALPLALELKGKEEISDLFQLLSISQEAQKKTAKAYANFKKYHTYQDRIINAEKNEAVEEIAAKYETEKKEAQIQALSQEKEIQDLRLKQQRYGLIGLGGILVLLLSAAFLIVHQRRLKEEQRITELELQETKKRLDIEQQSRASELKAIRSQMNPHFVFNALNSIQDYIMSNEKKLAGKYLGKFADLMRIFLEHSQVKQITIAEEIDALQLYLELEKLRFEDKLSSKIIVDDSIDTGIMIPSLLLQPYVENAIKHGLLHKADDRQLEISISSEKAMLKCEIIDNGVGRKKSAEINKIRNPNHKSFASKAVKSRLELLNHDRKNPIIDEVIDLYNDEGEPLGTKVLILIPLNDEFDLAKRRPTH